MQQGSQTRGNIAGQVSGGGQSNVDVGSSGVDLNQLVQGTTEQPQVNETASVPFVPDMPAAPTGGTSLETMAQEAVSSLPGAAARTSAPEISTRSTARAVGSSNTQAASTAPIRATQVAPTSTGTATGSTTPAASSQAAVVQQPAMHPGSNLVLNMESGLLTQGSGGGAATTDGQQVQAGDNQLDQSGYTAPAPRASESTSPETGRKRRNSWRDILAKSLEDDAAMISQKRDERILRQQGQQEIMDEGIISKPETPRILSSANKTFRRIKNIVQDKVMENLRGRSYSGMSFYETIFSKPDLMPHCVSLGSENLRESLREPNSTLLQLVNQKLKEADPNAQTLSLEDCLNHIELLVDAINSLSIEVTLDKTPVNINHSIQVRTLRAHQGRGIGLHPTQTKAFNSDYDGDPAQVRLEQEQLMRYARAMDRLVSSDGKPLIDPAFFPLDPIQDRAEVLDLLKTRNMSWSPAVAEQMIDAYMTVCNEGDWVGFLRRIDEVADEYAGLFGGSRNEVSSAILKSLYDFSIDRRGLILTTQLDSLNTEHANYLENMPETTRDPIVVELVNLTDEIIAGRPAPSFTEFTKRLNKFFGDIRDSEGRAKNVPYRTCADYANAINRTDLITIGSDLLGFKLVNNNGTRTLESDPNAMVSLHDLWQLTCAAALTKQISGRVHLGSRQLAVSTKVKSMVMRDCPIEEWQNEEQFRDWLSRFRESYNLNMRMLNLAQISFLGGMTPVRGSSQFNGIGENYEDIAEAFVRVYGQRTIGSVFPSLIRQSGSDKDNTATSIARFYRNMTVDKFVMNNRFVSRSNNHVSQFEEIKNRLRNNEFTQMDILMLIADRRSKQLGEFHESWLKATEEQFNSLGDMYKYNGTDFEEYRENIMEVIALMSPDMFLYYHMDSPSNFMNSKYGKRLLGSESLDSYRSTLLSMMVEYRFGRANSILNEMKDAENNIFDNGQAQVTRLEELDAAFENELEVLGSSSPAWKAIINETMNGSAIFHQLMKDEGSYKDSSGAIWERIYARQKLVTDEKTGKEVLVGEKFWNRPAEEKEKYYSLMNFLKSSEPFDVKIAVLADVARVSEQYPNMSPSEMLGQLAHHPDRAHAGGKFDMDKGLRGEIDSVKESSRLLSSYKDNTPDKIAKEAEKLLKFARKNKQGFESYLKHLTTDPGFAVYVDPISAADAVASVYDKTYADKEKTKQQATVNGYFGCVSMQRSGGFYTHLYMTDNAVVNTVGFDQITPQDIVRVLSDPRQYVNTYDEFGTSVRLTRESICGGNTIDDVIKYLERNPRVALSCRRHMAGVDSKVDGNAKLNAFNDAKFGIDDTYKTFSLLDDRPKFLAIAALITPGNNDVGRNMSEKINDSIKDLCRLVNEGARRNIGAGLDEWLASRIGISPDIIMKFNNEGRFDETEFTKEDQEAAQYLYEEVITELIDCIGLVQSSGLQYQNDTELLPDKIGQIDASSIIAYYDARQQISGARTAMMIGVEGSETKKNLVLKDYLQNHIDKYTMSEDGTTVVPLTEENEPASDLSLVRDPEKMISSVSKFLEIKRENGAETFNAKFKKYGDDKLNSMIKFVRLASDRVLRMFGKRGQTDMPYGAWSIEDSVGLLDSIAACATKEDAVPILAKALIDADIRMGYIDVSKETGKINDESFVPSDYWNRADLMLAQNSDGTLVVRTLEQLSAAMRTRLSDDATVSGSRETVMSELDAIVETLGTDQDPMLTQYGNAEIIHQCLYGVRLNNSVSSKRRIDRAMRQRSSSVERNYALLNQIYEHFCDEMHITEDAIPSADYLKDLSTRKFNEYKASKYFKKEISEELKGIVFPKDKWEYDDQLGWLSVENPDGSRDSLYDFLGTFRDTDLRLVPGPQSIVLFDGEMDDVQTFNRVISQCAEYGITALFTKDMFGALANSEYLDNLIFMGDQLAALPFFDIRLNGMMTESIVTAPAETPINPDNLVINVEDTTGEFREGDATYHITKELADRIKVMFRGIATFPAERLFPNVLGMFPRSDFVLDYCTNEEVQKYIINADFDPDTLTMKGFDEAVIDIGIPETHPAFEREKQRFAIRLNEYKAAFDTADSDSLLRNDVGYDSIVGFVKLTIDGQYTVLAPIWPFHLEEGTIGYPTQFAIDRDIEGRALFELDNETNSFNLSWKYTGGMEGQYIKAFEGIGASNKMIAAGEYARSRELENGLSIDGFYSTESVSSRLFPSNKRIYTMITAMMITRMDPKYAYNFAMDDGAFPGNPTITRADKTVIDVKQGLISATLGITDWQLIKEANIQYHTDQDIDRLIRFWVDKCVAFGTVNPTTLLATKTNNGILWPKITEFEVFMDPGYNFQKAWMKFMHKMNPSLMPEDIDSDSSATLFKPVTKANTDEDYGVLQMRVPHFNANGETYYKAENVYISLGFFGEEFSGFKKVNFNGRKRTLDNLNVANHVEGDDLVQLLTFARAGMTNVVPASRLEAVPDNAIKKPEEISHNPLPDEDGVTHVNVYSQGKTELGKFLSNFARTPIETPEGRFESIEGYWHYLGLPANSGREQLKNLYGAEARKVGQELRKKYGTERRDDFKDKIREAIVTKLETYKDKWINDDLRFYPLEHYYVSNGAIRDQRKQFGWLTDMIEEEINRIEAGEE